MPEDDVQKMGADFGDYFAAVDRLIKYNRKMAEDFISLGRTLRDQSGALTALVTSWNEGGNRSQALRDKLKLLGAAFDEKTGKVKLTHRTLRDYLQAYKQAVKDTDNYTSAVERMIAVQERQIATLKRIRAAQDMKRPYSDSELRAARPQYERQLTPDATPFQSSAALDAQIAAHKAKIRQAVSDVRALQFTTPGEIDTGAKGQARLSALLDLENQRNAAIRQAVAEEQRRNALLQTQQALYNRLADDNRRMVQYERERNQAAQRRAEIEGMQNRAQNIRAGGGLQENLRTRYTQGLVSLATLGPVEQHIQNIVREVQNGELQVERVLTILGQVERREAQIFEGAAARVAASARALQAGNTRYGDQTPLLNRQQFAVRTIIDQNNQLRLSFADTLASGQGTAAGIILSWTAMARLFEIQALHTVLRVFINELHQAITTTMDFQKRISEIRTITQDQPRTFNEWATAVRRLSDEFGNPILEVTEGLYETISNQVGKGTDAINFMRKAMEFGRVTHASTADSVNLLSAALNSFSLTAAESGRIAAIFFSVIDKGRIRANEIANTIGRVLPQAKAIGVTLEEVGGALATITNKGVPAEESMVLLNNIMTHLAKPSEEMIKFFDEIGVSSAESAISIYGFGKLMALIEERTRGTTTEMAKMFPEMRAMRGGLIFAGDGLKTYQQNVDAATNSQEAYNKAIAISGESPAFQLTRELNQIKNVSISDFGQSFITAALDISHALSDEGLLGVFKELGTWIARIGVAYLSYRAALIALTVVEEGRNILLTASAAVELQRTAALQATRIAEEALIAATLRRLEIETLVFTATQAEIVADAALLAALEARVIAQAQLTLVTRATAVAQAEATAAGQLVGVTYAQATVAAEARTVAEQALAAAQARVAVAQEAVAVSGAQAAAAQGRLAVGTTAVRGAFASLAGTLLNPAFLLTAAIAGSIYLIYKYREMKQEIADAYSKSKEAASQYYAKIQEEADKASTKQLETFRLGLTKQFAAYEYFAGQVSKSVNQITQTYKDAAAEQANIVKDSLREYVRQYDEATSKIKQREDQYLAEARKAQEELAKMKESAADRDFRSKMRQAEQKDKAGVPGKVPTLFEGEQLKLVNAEVERLRTNAANLLKDTGDPKKNLANQTLAMKDFARIQDLIEDTEQRRFKIEDARKALKEQLAEMDARAAEKAKERQNAEESADIRKEKHAASLDYMSRRRGRSGAKQYGLTQAGLTGDQDENADARRSLQDQEAERREKEQRSNLQQQLDALDRSADIIPEINKFAELRAALEKQIADSLKSQEKTALAIAANEEKARKAREAGIIPLKAVFEDIEKFKFEQPGKPVTTSEEVKARNEVFIALIAKAQQAGLTDQATILKLIGEQTALKMLGEQQVRDFQQNTDKERLAANKRELEDRFKAGSDAVKELGNKTGAILGGIGGAIGVEGPLQKILENAPAIQGTVGALEEAKGQLQKVREEYFKIMDAQKGGAIVPQAQIDSLLKQVQALRNMLFATTGEKDAYGHLRSRIQLDTRGTSTQDFVVESGRKDQTGKPIGDLTLGNIVAILGDQARSLADSLKQQTVLLQANKDLEAQITRLKTAQQALESAYSAANLQVQAHTKSTKFLVDECNNLIKGMQALDAQIKGMVQPKPAPLPSVINPTTGKPIAYNFTPNAPTQYFGGAAMSQVPNVQVSFGDITVEGTGNPAYDAQKLVSNINKELRRGSVKFNTETA